MPNDSMLGHRLRSQARATMSELRSQTYALVSALEKNPEDPALLKALKRLDALSKATAIERRVEILSDKQAEVFDAWFNPQYATVAALGANRSGKTFGLAPAVALDIREIAPPNSRVLCVAKDAAQSARNQQKELWDLLPHHMMDLKWTGDKNGFASKNATVRYDPHGRNISIIFLTQTQYDDDPSSFEAITAYRAWADEALTRGCMAAIGVRLATAEDARFGISTIPSEEWIDDFRAEAASDPTIHITEFAVKDNPVMTEAKIRRMSQYASFAGDDMMEMRMMGKSLVSGSRVYTEFDRSKHVRTHAEFMEETGGNVKWYGCLDEGMDHPTVFLLVAVDASMRYWVASEYVSRNTEPERDVANIKALIGNRQLERPTIADPALWQNRKTGMSAKRYAEAGLPLRKSKPTNKWGEDHGVMMIKNLLNTDSLMVMENCKHLISNFSKWKYKRNREGDFLETDRYQDKDNDALDALRYLVVTRPTYTPKKSRVYAF